MPVKEIEHPAKIGSHNTTVTSTVNFDVLMFDTQPFHFCQSREAFSHGQAPDD